MNANEPDVRLSLHWAPLYSACSPESGRREVESAEASHLGPQPLTLSVRLKELRENLIRLRQQEQAIAAQIASTKETVARSRQFLASFGLQG